MDAHQSITELTKVLKMTLESVQRLEDKLDLNVHGIYTERDLYSTKEAAEILGLAEYTVRQHCNKGVIEAEKTTNRRWRISRDAIARFKDSR